LFSGEFFMNKKQKLISSYNFSRTVFDVILQKIMHPTISFKNRFKVLNILSIRVIFLLFLGSFSGSIYSENSKEPLSPDTPTQIKAKVTEEKNSVYITWTPPREEGDVIIARSKSMIDTPDKLYVADSLGILSYKDDIRISDYRDINLRPGQYYYAVALVSSVRRRQVQLLADKNFTSTPVTIYENENPPTSTVDSKRFIKSIDIQKVDTGLKIAWEPPDDADKSRPIYSLYRSNSPLNTIAAMQNATKVIEMDHPDTTFTDRSKYAVSGVYYGVSVTIKGEEFIPLQEDVSFARYGSPPPAKKKKKPLSKDEDDEDDGEEEEKPQPKKNKNNKKKTSAPEQDLGLVKHDKPVNIKEGNYVHEINIELQKDGMLLTWSPPTNVDLEGIVYSIYQSTSPLKNVQSLLDAGTAKKLGELKNPETKYKLKKEDKKKIFYYGVTVKLDSGEEFGLLEENDSYLKIYPEAYSNITKKENLPPTEEIEKKEEEKPAPEKEEGLPSKPSNKKPKPSESNEFNWIMSEYYKKGKFTVAHEKLLLLAETSEDPNEKGKALFYAALCQYNKKNYKDALKLLLKEEVQKNYEPDRVEFYIKQCIKNRSDG
jgi:hypothetical protein